MPRSFIKETIEANKISCGKCEHCKRKSPAFGYKDICGIAERLEIGKGDKKICVSYVVHATQAKGHFRYSMSVPSPVCGEHLNTNDRSCPYYDEGITKPTLGQKLFVWMKRLTRR